MTLAVFRATVWLGAKLSFVAAALAVVLSAIGDVSRWSLVIAVAVLAFAASWVQTGRVERGQSPLLVVRTVQRSG